MDEEQRSQLLNEAQQLVQQGKLAAAAKVCDDLIEADENDVNARKIAGYVAYTRGFLDAALGHFQRLVQLLPTAPESHLNEAKVHVKMGRPGDAERAYDEALDLQPGHVPSLIAKAELLTMVDRADEARSLLTPLVDSPEEVPRVALILATIDRQAGRFDEAIAQARRFCDRPATPPITRAHLFFEIGRGFDGLGQYDDAFEAFMKGNKANAQLFDISKHEASVDDLIRVFSRKNMKSMQRSSVRSELPVFVVGMARSGTTLVEQIIDAHPRAFGAGELGIFPQIVSSMKERLGTQRPYPHSAEYLTRKSAQALGQTYLEFVQPLAPDADRIVDKALRMDRHIGLIQLILPGARIVHCRRDPMDTCLSCLMASLDAVQHPYLADLNCLGSYYRQYARLMAHWRDVGVEMIEVDYESMVEDSERESRRIIEHIGLPWDERCLKFYESNRMVRTLSYAQVRKPIYKSAVRRWKRYEKHLGPLRAALAGVE